MFKVSSSHNRTKKFNHETSSLLCYTVVWIRRRVNGEEEYEEKDEKEDVNENEGMTLWSGLWALNMQLLGCMLSQVTGEERTGGGVGGHLW